jgi:hypothetical protein
MPESKRGYVYATTGEKYTILARKAVRNLRQVMPNAEVDLFTDQDIDDPNFTQVHKLDRTSHRPKMEAMRRSRFRRTVMLDADAFPVMPVNELFALCDRFEFAATQTFIRPKAVYKARPDIPMSFPQFNGGVLLFEQTVRVKELIQRWEHAVVDGNQELDQPALRGLLWDLRINVATLPREYNMIYTRFLDHWPASYGTPKILHLRDLHRNETTDPTTPVDFLSVVGEKRAAVLKARLAGNGRADMKDPPPEM